MSCRSYYIRQKRIYSLCDAVSVTASSCGGAVVSAGASGGSGICNAGAAGSAVVSRLRAVVSGCAVSSVTVREVRRFVSAEVSADVSVEVLWFLAEVTSSVSAVCAVVRRFLAEVSSLRVRCSVSSAEVVTGRVVRFRPAGCAEVSEGISSAVVVGLVISGISGIVKRSEIFTDAVSEGSVTVILVGAAVTTGLVTGGEVTTRIVCCVVVSEVTARIAFQSIVLAPSFGTVCEKSNISKDSLSRSFLAITTNLESEYSFEQVESTSSWSP